MKTSLLSRFVNAPVLAIALAGLASALTAQIANLPTVSIRGSSATPEFCPPNVDCPGINFLLTRTGPGLENPLRVRIGYYGTALPGIDYQLPPYDATFAAGQDRITISSQPIDDLVYEGDETIQARLLAWNTSSANQYIISSSNGTATTTIVDNDPPRLPPLVSLQLIQREAMETSINQNAIFWAEFRVDRIGTATNELTVYIDATQGSARLDEDYRLENVSNGTAIRFPAGFPSVTVRLYPIDDVLYEGDETVSIRLVAPPDGTPGSSPYEIDGEKSSVAMIIHDNDSSTASIVSIRASQPVTTEPLCDPAICDAPVPAPGVFVISRQGGDISRELSVPIRVQGTATSGVDYAALPSFVVFGAGASTVELLVEASHDTLIEGDEAVVAELQPDPTLGPFERYRVDPNQASARVVIHDNDLPPSPIVSIEASSPIAEESSYPYRRLPLRGRFTLSRTGPTEHETRVFVLYGGTAKPGVDYPFLPWLATIPAGTNRIDIDVVPNQDDVPEPIETVTATLSECPPDTNPPLGMPCYGANIDPARSTAVVFIRDDGITTASLEITAPKDGVLFSLGEPIHIAATALDLKGAITHVEFFDGDSKIGESSIYFFREPDPGTPVHHEFTWLGAAAGPHLLTVRATDSGGASVTSAPVRMLVGSGEFPVVGIRATQPITAEPCPVCLVAPGVFTVSRSGGSTNESLTVWYLLGGTAANETDYARLAGQAIIPAGRESVQLLVLPVLDNLREGDETVVAQLVVPANSAAVRPYRIDPEHGSAVITIRDSLTTPPGAPLVSISAPDPFAREGAYSNAGLNTATFVVSRAGPTNDPLAVRFSLGGSASNGVDYAALTSPLVIPAGQRHARLVVQPIDDGQPEPVETVVVILQADLATEPAYELGASRRAAALIVDNDCPRPKCMRLPDGRFNLCLSTDATHCYRVESTRDCKVWTAVCTIPVSDGAAQFVDPDPDETQQKFYRLVPVACEPE